MLKKLISKPTDKINICTDDNGTSSFTIIVTFKTIAEIMNNRKENLLETPIFQVDLDEDKINEMKQSYLKHPSYFLNKSMVTIANIKVGDDEVNYIIDGQHRMEMVTRLNYEENKNMRMLLTVHMVKHEEELIDIFDDINKDSTKNKEYVKLPIFKKQEQNQVKLKLEQKYKGFYAKKKSQVSHIKTLSEFVTELDVKGFFTKNCDMTVDEMVNYINNQHKLFFNYVGYLEKQCESESIYYKDENEMIKHYQNVIFFKNNNFIDYLITEDTPIHVSSKGSRKTVTKSKRQQVWANEFKQKSSGLCPVKNCNQLLRLDESNGFQCGHIISKKNGGTCDVENLRPICANCNSKMGSLNWNEFILKQDDFLEEIKILFESKSQSKIKDDCDEDEYGTIDCDLCSKTITFEKSNYFKLNETPYIVCNKCYSKQK